MVTHRLHAESVRLWDVTLPHAFSVLPMVDAAPQGGARSASLPWAAMPCTFDVETGTTMRFGFRPVHGPCRAAVIGPSFRTGNAIVKRLFEPRSRGFSLF